MKIILTAINAKYIHTNTAVRYIKNYYEMHRKDSATELEIFETTINSRAELTRRELYLKKPDIIAFSCYVWNIEMIFRLCCELKMLLPETKIILGGPEVSFCAADIMKEHDYIDFIICGEGEKIFSELVYSLEKNKNASDVLGICFRTEKGIIEQKSAETLDMSELPFPYEIYEQGQNELSALSNKILYYEASRGCPFDCSYCISSAEKSGVRFAPLEKVKRELLIFIENNVSQVKFIDRTFNCSKNFSSEIIKFLIENDNGITNFHFEIEAFTLNDDLISLLQSARKGLFQLEIGVQSTNSRTLSAVNRKGDFEKIKSAVLKLMAPQNSHIHLDLIAGLPFEDIKSFRNSFNDVFLLYPDNLQLGFLKMLNGTGIRNKAQSFNAVFSPFSPYEILSTDCLSHDDILKLKAVEEVLEIYYNSGRFKHTLSFLMKIMQNIYETPFDFFEALSEYIAFASEYALTDTGKLIPYKMLIDFFKNKNSDKNSYLHYLVRFDMLLHEKLNVIPQWLDISYDKTFSEQALKKLCADGFIKEKLPECIDMQSRQLSKVIHIEKFPFNPKGLCDGKNDETIMLFYYNDEKKFRDTKTIIVNPNDKF